MHYLLEPHREAIEALCREYQVTRLELFGSATRADFDDTHSDIDLLVEFAPTADLGPWISRFFELRDALTALLGRHVDLVFAKSLHNPYLIQSVNRDRQLIYASEYPKVA